MSRQEFMTYEDAVAYILEVPKFTSKTSLAHTTRLLEILGHPEDGQKVLHVAGTNGKGSVCADLDAMLRAAGCSVGLFTSPHLVRINERIRVGGKEIPDEAFLSAFRRVMEASEQIRHEGEAHPTFFEILFLMAMAVFREAGVEYTVLETGMGGRLDATNVIRRPLASVITSVSLDHTMYLGETVTAIAGEKAGIIKPGVPVVYDAGKEEVCAVIRKRAESLGSPAFPLTRDRVRIEEMTEEGISFFFRETNGSETHLRIPQTAPYQMRNAALAWHTLRVLEEEIPVSEDARIRGLASVRWPGRMQPAGPGIYIDGAHNPEGIEGFLEAAEGLRGQNEVTLLFSAVGDKAYPDMVRQLSRFRPDRVVVTRIGGRRAVSEEKLAELFRAEGCPAVFADPDPEKAFRTAVSIRGEGLLFCVGSLYLAGELLKAAEREEGAEE